MSEPTPLGVPPVPDVKICGVRSERDAMACVEAGADAIGVNLHEGSKRHVRWEEAGPWLRRLDGVIRRVAVVVNQPPERVEEICGSGLVDAVQLHGVEDPAYCLRLLGAGGRVRLTRAFALESERVLEEMALFPSGVDFLVDAYVPGHWGGTGVVADWALAARCVRDFPRRHVALSGGLTPDNIRAAVAEVRPRLVDVASGVESAPGVKDAEKVARFVGEAKAVSRE